MTYIKICGLRDAAMANVAIRAGADAVGVVMSSGSPRNADDAEAASVAAAARPTHAESVLVTADLPAAVAARLARDLGFDILQLHGSRYSPDAFAEASQIMPRVWRAISLRDDPRLRAGSHGEERLLIDGSVPGSGERWDLKALASIDTGREWLLAGGLSPETVVSAIAQAVPWGVDVSSGVEGVRGVKSAERIREFISAVRAA